MAYRENPPKIDADALVWGECGVEGDKASRLLAHIQIAGVNMHLEAWEISHDEEFQTVKESTMRSEDFQTIVSIMDSYFDTATINGREYVLIAVPYGR